MLRRHPLLNKLADGSHGNFDNRFGDGAGNWFPVFLQAFEITLDGITNIRHRFVASLSLGNAAGQCRAFRNENAILIRLDPHAKFHRTSLATGDVIGNCTPSLPSQHRKRLATTLTPIQTFGGQSIFDATLLNRSLRFVKIWNV